MILDKIIWEICIKVAEYVVEKIEYVKAPDVWIDLTHGLCVNGNPKFFLEYDDSVNDIVVYEFDTDGRCLRIHGVPSTRDAWLTYPWQIRAFVEGYNFMIEHALGSVNWIDNIITNERSAR